MERCPVCHARFKGDPVCYRCGTDLSRPLTIEAQAIALEKRAVTLLAATLEKPAAALFGAEDLREARRAAEQAAALRRSPLALALVAFLERELRAAQMRAFERLIR